MDKKRKIKAFVSKGKRAGGKSLVSQLACCVDDERNYTAEELGIHSDQIADTAKVQQFIQTVRNLKPSDLARKKQLDAKAKAHAKEDWAPSSDSNRMLFHLLAANQPGLSPWNMSSQRSDVSKTPEPDLKVWEQYCEHLRQGRIADARKVIEGQLQKLVSEVLLPYWLTPSRFGRSGQSGRSTTKRALK